MERIAARVSHSEVGPLKDELDLLYCALIRTKDEITAYDLASRYVVSAGCVEYRSELSQRRQFLKSAIAIVQPIYEARYEDYMTQSRAQLE